MRTIVGASRALVQLPDTPIFTNTVKFSSSTTWMVPNANGDGSDVEVSFDLFGAGGGGGGGELVHFLSCGNTIAIANGGAGGNGGKGVVHTEAPRGDGD